MQGLGGDASHTWTTQGSGGAATKEGGGTCAWTERMVEGGVRSSIVNEWASG